MASATPWTRASARKAPPPSPLLTSTGPLYPRVIAMERGRRRLTEQLNPERINPVHPVHPVEREAPMRFANAITAVDTHVCGEPGRIITGGVLDVPGQTMFEKRLYLER